MYILTREKYHNCYRRNIKSMQGGVFPGKSFFLFFFLFFFFFGGGVIIQLMWLGFFWGDVLKNLSLKKYNRVSGKVFFFFFGGGGGYQLVNVAWFLLGERS